MAQLTPDERYDIVAQFRSALDQNTRDLASLAIRQKYAETDKWLYAEGLVNSLERLYQLCPRGTEVSFTFLFMRGERRHYKFMVAYRDGATGKLEVAALTGYILDLGIGKQGKGEGTYTLTTTGFGEYIVRSLSGYLYGDDNALAYHNI